MHTSIAVQNTIEFLDIVRINPLISKCKIKVCYVGDEPNRNKSIITEDVAREIAQTLPGSPIVGYFNETKEDFESHNEIFLIKDGNIVETTNTRPYGFVDLNAKVWFEEYLDDGRDYRKYLVTEGYLWTGQYPEAKEIFNSAQGNPQSLEFDTTNNTLDAFWTKDYNGNKQFFIINEAVISKLCILGNDIEPCFEGASVSKFSLEEGFKETMFSFITEMKNILKEEGGTTMSLEVQDTPIVDDVPAVEEPIVEPVVEEPIVEPAPAAEPIEEPVVEEPVTEEPVVEEPAAPVEGEGAEPTVNTPASYSLEDISEYQELLTTHNTLVENYSLLETEVNELRTFRASVEKKEKETLINSFYMLSDEDKEDVVNNIDKYSYDDIKSKLSVICVDKRVSFSTEKTEETAPITYNLNGDVSVNSDTQMPAWLQQVQKYNK